MECGRFYGIVEAQRLHSGNGHVRHAHRQEGNWQRTFIPSNRPRFPSLLCSTAPFSTSTLKPKPAHPHRASPCCLPGSSSVLTHQVSAVIFDLDDTLLDTESVTRGVLKDFLARYGKSADTEKEEGRLGQSHREQATGIIKDYGLPLTVEECSEEILSLCLKSWQKAKPLPGVKRLLRHLHKNGVPLALASNSRRRIIDHKLLKLEDLKDYFRVVLGVDQVPNGKPCPDIYLEAAKRLGVNPSSCLVIEDSLVGVQGAKASGAKVVAVPSLQTEKWHYSSADLILNSLLDFHPELWGLPQFDDRIQGALPMEPIFSHVQIGDAISNSIHGTIAGEHTYDSIPGQISGIVVGWAKLEAHVLSKVVVSIGWDLSLPAVGRVMHICFVDSCCNVKTGEPLELILIGYVRELLGTGNISQALTITDEDQSIGRDALDLPAFAEIEKLTSSTVPGAESSQRSAPFVQKP